MSENAQRIITIHYPLPFCSTLWKLNSLLTIMALDIDSVPLNNINNFPWLVIFWLVVSTPLKQISQLGFLFPNIWKNENGSNHQPIIIPIIFPLKPPLDPIKSPLDPIKSH